MLSYATKPKVQPPYTFVADKHNQRSGVILPLPLKQKMLSAVEEAKRVMRPKREAADVAEVVGAVEGIREATMECFPGYVDLPPWEPLLLVLEEMLGIEMLQPEGSEVYPPNASLWWAGKLLLPSNPIRIYCGANPKTRIIVRMQKPGAQMPPRQPPVDAKTYQQMVKYYYKKVEETKAFEGKSIEAHYETLQTESMKTKVHMQHNEIKYKIM